MSQGQFPPPAGQAPAQQSSPAWQASPEDLQFSQNPVPVPTDPAAGVGALQAVPAENVLECFG